MPYQLSRDGQLYGPYTLEDLQRYVATQNVLSTDLVKSEVDPEWVTVASLLGQGTPPPPAEYAAHAFGSIAPWQAEAVVPAPTVERYPFFPVSVSKFIVLSLITFGLYHVYWAYKNWVRIKADTGESIMPWARALFLGIWNFALFGDVDSRAKNDDIPVNWNYMVLGGAVLILAFTSRLPHGWGIISLLSFVPYIPVISTIEQINAKQALFTTENPNRNFSAINVVGIIIGGLFLLLAMIGLIGEITGAIPSR